MSHVRTALVAGTVTLFLLLPGCTSEKAGTARPSSGANGDQSANAASDDSTAEALNVVATLKLPPANALVATPHWLWVLGGPSGWLTKIDPKTNAVVAKLKPPHPPGFGTYAHGSLWMASLDDDAVMQVDADTGRVLRSIESSHGQPFYRPIGIAVAGQDLWVVNHGDDDVASSVTHLNAHNGVVTSTTDLPGHHAGSPLFVKGDVWIALNTEGTVARLDPHTGRLVGSPIVVDTGTCLAASMADGALWYSGLGDGEGGACRTVARRIEPPAGDVLPTRYGPGKKLVEFADVGGAIWASSIGRTIYRVDVGSGAVDPSLTLPGPAATNRLLAAFGSLWVLGGESGQVVRLDVP